jgi:hypothetical protein
VRPTLAGDYVGEIDAFCVYCPDTAGVYLVPIDELPAKMEGPLRAAPTRNGQVARTRSAANYLVAETAVPMAASSAAQRDAHEID